MLAAQPDHPPVAGHQGIANSVSHTVYIKEWHPCCRCRLGGLRPSMGLCSSSPCRKAANGSGGGGKNPLRTVLMIAVMVVATVGGLGLESLQDSAGNADAADPVQAASSTAGSALVGIQCAPTPYRPLPGGSGEGSATIAHLQPAGSGQLCAAGQPIPVIYGRHLVLRPGRHALWRIPEAVPAPTSLLAEPSSNSASRTRPSAP